jgi:hypothetical protein
LPKNLLAEGGAWAEETLRSICIPLSIAIGFVPRLFPFLSGLLGAEEYFSAFIMEKIEAEMLVKVLWRVETRRGLLTFIKNKISSYPNEF